MDRLSLDLGKEQARTRILSLAQNRASARATERRMSASWSESCHDTKTSSLLKFLSNSSNNGNGRVKIYQPGKHKAKYFRYSCKVYGRRKRHHIPGGNINSPIAIERAKQVKIAIDANWNYYQILDLVKSF